MPGETRPSGAYYFFFFFGLTFQSTDAGVGSTFPAASMARTWKLCLPLPTLVVSGEVQGSKLAASRLHSKPATALASVPVNSNVAVLLLLLEGGPFVICVSGGFVSPLGPGSGSGPGSGGLTGGSNSSAPMSGSGPLDARFAVYVDRAELGCGGGPRVDRRRAD